MDIELSREGKQIKVLVTQDDSELLNEYLKDGKISIKAMRE